MEISKRTAHIIVLLDDVFDWGISLLFGRETRLDTQIQIQIRALHKASDNLIDALKVLQEASISPREVRSTVWYVPPQKKHRNVHTFSGKGKPIAKAHLRTGRLGNRSTRNKSTSKKAK